MKNAGKACNNRLYRHIRTFEKIVKNYFVISFQMYYTYIAHQKRFKNLGIRKFHILNKERRCGGTRKRGPAAQKSI